MREAIHPDGQLGRHWQPRRGSQLGRKSDIALLLIAEAGGHRIHLCDIPAIERHYVNSKAGALEEMALIVCHGPSQDPTAPASDHRPSCSLAERGRTTVDLIRGAVGT